MNATGLPIPTASSAPAQTAAAEPASSAVAVEQRPADFVLALAQMIGASVPSQATSVATGAQIDTDGETHDENAAVLALLSLPMGQVPQQAQIAQGVEADPLELLGLTSRPENASVRDAAILRALTERLAGVVDESSPETQPHGAALGGLESAQRPTTAAATAHARPMQHPVGTQAWADELGSRLTMMTEKGQHTASLRLSPEHLGPLEIRIAMREDQASVWFGAAHADTRAAIEHALPRLRELFAAQGMSLADAGVFREPPKQQPSEWHGTSREDASAHASSEAAVTAGRVQVGLLDTYA